MSAAAFFPHPATQADRRHLRRERQARVGILRNTNAPPKPPTRRAALTGKWPSLRSSRRASQALVDDLMRRIMPAASHSAPKMAVAAPPPPAAAPHVAPQVRTKPDGTVASIDVQGLMETIEEPRPTQPVRAPFAAEYRAAVDQSAKAIEASQTPPILRAEAWDQPLNTDTSADRVEEPPAPRRRRRAQVLSLILRAGLLFCLAAFGLFLAVLFLQLLSPVPL